MVETLPSPSPGALPGDGSIDDLIVLRPEGLYCRAGDFYIDPWRPVARAVITHAHADHARPGMGEYHAAAEGLALLRWRLGERDFHAHDYGAEFRIGGARVSLHPAGHVLGSAQVRVEAGDEVWVASGDYKRQPDPTCTGFAPQRCDVFITEATFGLPIYRWPDTADVAREIAQWREECAAEGATAVLFCYALGKAQRLLAELGAVGVPPVWLHGAVATGVAAYRSAGVALPDTHAIDQDARGRDYAGDLVLAPPSAAGSAWMRRFKRVRTGFASGWMQLRGNRRRRNIDRGFVVSDHADWPALLHTIAQTGAQRVLATHGNIEALVRVLNESGVHSTGLRTAFGDDGGESADAAADAAADASADTNAIAVADSADGA
jgi:putative mRNA 3-end processing factor